MKQYIEIGEQELRDAGTEYLEKKGIKLSPDHTIEIFDGCATVMLKDGDGPSLKDAMRKVVLATAETLNIRHLRCVDDAEFFKLCNKIMDKMGRSEIAYYTEKDIKQ